MGLDVLLLGENRLELDKCKDGGLIEGGSVVTEFVVRRVFQRVSPSLKRVRSLT